MKISHAFLLGLGLNLLSFASASAVTLDSGLLNTNAYATDHFSVEFSDLILGQTDADGNGLPDLVDTVSAAAEYSRGVVIDDLNYPDPMAGYNRKIIIVLDDRDEYLSPGAMGVTSLLSNGDPFISIDPWMSESDLQITVGHEYFHTVQFGYDDGFAYTDQGANWAEETATWMEDQEYDNNNDYVNYIPEYFDYVDYSVFASIVPSGTLYQYGLMIWPRFLAEYYNTGVIKDIWESYVNSSASYTDDRKLYNAVSNVIQSYDSTLRTVYRDFSLWNLDLAQYSEGDSYPGVYTLDGQTAADYQEINHDFAPALFGTNYLYFDNTSGDSTFYFHIVKPDGVSFAVTLVPYDNGAVDLSKEKAVIVEQSASMGSILSLGNLNGVDGVYAVVSPLDTSFSGDHTSDFDEGYLYNFFAQYGATGEDYSGVISGDTTTTTTTDTPTTDTTDTKEGVSGGTVVPSSKSLVLTVASYNESSVSFSWNRLTDTTIAGYELRYGTKSGDYNHSLEVDHAYTTATTLTGLTQGKQYYFELVALNSGGHGLGNPSPEVSVTPEPWIFSDVSYLNDHYDAIAALTDLGIFGGYADSSFKPEATINRAELLKILVEGRDLSPSADSYKNCFSDVGTEWYAKYVCYAKAQGWVGGYSDGSFKPGNAVNKVEALKILFQVYQSGLKDGAVFSALSYSDLDQNAWYAGYVENASELGILEEKPGVNFDPSNSRTRGEMAEELYRYLVVQGLIKQ